MEDTGVREAQDKDWETLVENNPHPVLVMYYSPTCRHCTQMKPYFEELSREYSGKVTFVTLNITRFSWHAERYGIMATPTIQYFCSGRPVQTRVGVVFPAMLKKMIGEMMEHADECRLRSTEIKYEISGYG